MTLNAFFITFPPDHKCLFAKASSFLPGTINTDTPTERLFLLNLLLSRKSQFTALPSTRSLNTLQPFCQYGFRNSRLNQRKSRKNQKLADTLHRFA
jgi:hypothetical protein